MSDLYKRTEVDFGGGMTSQYGLIVPNKGLTGILMQNFTMQYQQNVTRIYEIGKSGAKTNVYYVGGRASGTISSAHIIGPGPTMRTFYDNFSDICQAATNDLQIQLSSNQCPTSNAAGAAAGGAAAAALSAISYRAKYCVLVSIGVGVTAQEFVINENSNMMFSGLEYL